MQSYHVCIHTCVCVCVCVCVCNLPLYVQGINEPGSSDRGVSAKGAWQDASTAASHRQQASAHPTDKRQQAYTYPTDASVSPVTHALSLSSLQSSPLDFEDALRAAGFGVPVKYSDTARTDPSSQADDDINPKRLGLDPTPMGVGMACTDPSCQADDCGGAGPYAARPRPRTRRLASKRQAEGAGGAGKVGERGGLGAMPGASAPFCALTDMADECWT